MSECGGATSHPWSSSPTRSPATPSLTHSLTVTHCPTIHTPLTTDHQPPPSVSQSVTSRAPVKYSAASVTVSQCHRQSTNPFPSHTALHCTAHGSLLCSFVRWFVRWCSLVLRSFVRRVSSSHFGRAFVRSFVRACVRSVFGRP